MNDSKSIGVFWDNENIPAWVERARIPLAERILELLKHRGYFKLLQVYGKWHPHDKILKGLYALGFKPISVPMTMKNSADIKLAVDCIVSSYENDIDIFVIISADKDFIPVINHIKSIGKQIIVIAKQKNSSEYITISPNEYIAIESILSKDELSKLEEGEAERSKGKIVTNRKTNSNLTKRFQRTNNIGFEELKENLRKLLANSVKNGIILNISKIHTELQNQTNNKYISYSKVMGPNNKKYSNFKSLLKDLIDTSKYEIINDEVSRITVNSNQVTPPEANEWITFLNYIENYFNSKPVQSSIFSRLNLINQLQKLILAKEGVEMKKYDINDKIEFLINLGLLIEDSDLNFDLGSSFKTKREVFIKSFNKTAKQSSLVETLP